MRHLKFAPSWLRFLIIFLLTMGILFRFFNLDGKVYWHDETYTSLRISGYTINEAKQQLFTNRVIGKESFAQFQGANPENSLNATIMTLAKENPYHPPLYYVIARLWMEIFGNSVTAIRSLSAFISLLVFPCVYWLCRELFNVPLSVPGVAIRTHGNFSNSPSLCPRSTRIYSLVSHHITIQCVSAASNAAGITR